MFANSGGAATACIAAPSHMVKAFQVVMAICACAGVVSCAGPTNTAVEAADLDRQALPQLADASDQWRAYLFNVDDQLTMKINGKVAASVAYRQTANVRFEHLLKTGKNQVALELVNTGGPWTYGYQIFKNEVSIASGRCGNNVPTPSTPCAGQNTGLVWSYALPITKFGIATQVSKSKMRGGPGVFGYKRVKGAHQGVDLVPIQSSLDRSDYQVVAVDDGVVAYARINGAPADGYGYTVIVEHPNGVYTLYAHLAILASQNVVKLEQPVTKGSVLGYMADLQNAERSSGNVADCHQVPLPVDKIQLHFEVFETTPHRRGDSINQNFKNGAAIVDPTPLLREVGYQLYDPSPQHQQPSPDCQDPAS